KPPRLVNLLNRIAAITRMDFASADVDLLKDRLKLLFTGYMLSSPIIGLGQKLYRGVAWSERASKVDQLRQPRPNRGNTCGRANRPSQSMFYASTARAAVFYELDPQPGQHIAIGRWCVNSKLWINNVGFTPDILRGHGANRDENSNDTSQSARS